MPENEEVQKLMGIAGRKKKDAPENLRSVYEGLEKACQLYLKLGGESGKSNKAQQRLEYEKQRLDDIMSMTASYVLSYR